jgi:hypothetical protein
MVQVARRLLLLQYFANAERMRAGQKEKQYVVRAGAIHSFLKPASIIVFGIWASEHPYRAGKASALS